MTRRISLLLVVFMLALSGCATQGGEIDWGKTAMVGVGVLAVGMIAANDSSDDGPAKQNCYWVVTGNGSTQVCD